MVCAAAKKCPPGPTSATASTPISSAEASTGWKSSANICSISTSRMNFSSDAVSPPSSQPAACSMKWQPPSSAPHRLIWDSYTAWASGALEAVALERSEERRVGKECRSRWAAYDSKKKKEESERAGDHNER